MGIKKSIFNLLLQKLKNTDIEIEQIKIWNLPTVIYDDSRRYLEFFKPSGF